MLCTALTLHYLCIQITTMEAFQTHILPNGLKIIHEPCRSGVAYFGVAVNVGSRDEDASLLGMAHFVEHTIFKGTKHRKSYHIVNRMERVGGEINAYTSKEETMVYSVFPSQYYDRAMELIADLVQHSQFPASELNKEREVVLDEVNSYLDTPSEAVYDDFEDLLFAGSGLGHNILGCETTLRTFTPEMCRTFIDRHYVPANMALFSAGDIDFARLCRLAEKHFGSLKNELQRIERVAPQVVAPFHIKREIDGYQSHTIYGAQVFGMYDSRKYALTLLNNILGGPGMNSLFNLSLRARRGYVYTVESSTTLFTDSGEFNVYFGCDSHHVKPCLRLIGGIIEDIAEHGISAVALDRAKRQYTGQLLIASENRESTSLSLGKSMLFYGKASTIAEISDRIKHVSSEVVREVASLLTPDKASTLTFA